MSACSNPEFSLNEIIFLFMMSVKYEISFEAGKLVHQDQIPPLVWYRLYLSSPLTVHYTESASEAWDIQVPDDFTGQITMEQRGEAMDVYGTSAGGNQQLQQVVVRIEHQGLQGLYLLYVATVQLTGCLPLEDVRMNYGGQLIIPEATFTARSLELLMGKTASCTMGKVSCERLSVRMSHRSQLQAPGIHCSDGLSVRTLDKAAAKLGGTSMWFYPAAFHSSRITSDDLAASFVRCYAFDKSSVTCNAGRVLLYVSPFARFHNACLEAEYDWKSDVSCFLPIRRVTGADFVQIALHLKYQYSTKLGWLTVYDHLRRGSRSISTLLSIKAKETLEEPGLYDCYGRHFAEADLKRYGKEERYIYVDDDVVDWSEIPDVRRRYLNAVPQLLECFE